MAKQGQAEFVKWMGPLLNALRSHGGQATPRAASDWIAEHEHVPTAVREAMLESGAERFHNQVQWARQYLVWEGLIDRSKRGVWTLTPLGYERHLDKDSSRDLFLKWVAINAEKRKAAKETEVETILVEAESSVPPDERDEEELLDVVKKLSPSGFERLCKRLLVELGFEEVEVSGGPHDKGIDGTGVIRINPVVSFKVIFQCKRWSGTVGSPEIAHLRNAVLGRADKGIIMTTGRFSSDARKEASREGVPPVELVDGVKLVELLQDKNLGVRPKTVYEVDYTFFEQFDAK